MKLYFIPFACSLATRIAVIESGINAEFIPVGKGGALPDGRAFIAISPMGYVPALETPGGLTLTEGPAVLQYLADLAEEGTLAPPNYADDRYRLQQWLNFISTELHKAVFVPLLGGGLDDAAREAIRARAAKPFTVLTERLADRDFLLDGFTVADAYLVVVLNWCEFAGVDLSAWPVLHAWRAAIQRRPSVAAAMAEERPLLKAA